MEIHRHWKSHEDKALLSLLQSSKPPFNWDSISQELRRHKIVKSSNQCKRRYVNHLSQNINNSKLNFEEQLQLFELFKEHGNSWKLISSYFNNRTDNIIKNTFFGMMRRCVRLMNKLTGQEMDNSLINVSKPNVILEYLLLRSDEGFEPRFTIFSCVDYFMLKNDKELFENFPESMILKAKHCIRLFKRTKLSDDNRPNIHKRIKKIKFIHEYNRKFNRTISTRISGYFGQLGKIKAVDHILHELDLKRKEILKLFDQKDEDIRELERHVTDLLIEFILYFRRNIVKGPYIRDLYVFRASKVLISNVSVFLVELAESHVKDLGISNINIQPFKDGFNKFVEVFLNSFRNEMEDSSDDSSKHAKNKGKELKARTSQDPTCLKEIG